MKVKSVQGRSTFLAVLFLAFTIGVTSWVCTKNPPLAPDDNPQAPLIVLVSLQSSPKIVLPSGSSVVQALLVDESNAPVSGSQITFATNFGTLTPSTSVTNEAGIATTTFRAPAQTGFAVITASYDSSQNRSLTIEVKDTNPQSITLVPDELSLLANGISSTRILSTWSTEEGEPLGGIPVAFETNVGSITSSATTDASGRASATFTSWASGADTVAQITARGFDTQATVNVLLKGIQFTLSSSPTTLIADGRSTASIKAVLKEASSFVAISDAQIILGADLGTIPNSAATNASGVAELNLTSATQTGIATITASYGQTLSKSVQIVFGQSVPTYLSVSAEPTVILADNQSTATIKATVSDQANNPVPDNTPVNFEIIDGSGTIESNQVTSAGVATSTLTSGNQPDTVRIVARVDQLADTTTVRYVVGSVAAVTVTADSSSLPANGTTSTQVRAFVYDAAGHPVLDGTRVTFEADIGDVTPTAQTNAGIAVASFTSNVTGLATIRASVGNIFDLVTIQLRPGLPNSILLSFNPTTLGVKDSGRNQSLTVTGDVVDSKNNPVADGTFVTFSIFSSPGGGEVLSNVNPIPTLNGRAQVSLNSGVRSGSVRILAEVTDKFSNPVNPIVRAVTTEIIIFAGPPYFENINDPSSSHLTVGTAPLNIFGWNVVNNTAMVTAVVGDKFNNPVPPGTAVFFTTTGGVISTFTGFTDEEGVATVTIHSAQPYPTIGRYYNTFFNPNENHPGFLDTTNVIAGPIPDYDLNEVMNSIGDSLQNDGITRILAVTEGVDSTGAAARVWSVTDLVFSGIIDVFEVDASVTTLSPGESSVVSFKIYDVNGNPIVPGSQITIQVTAGALSWNSLTTSDPGETHFSVLLTNNLDPTDPDARETATPVTIVVNSENGNVVQSSQSILLTLN